MENDQTSYLPEESDKPFAGIVREWYFNREVVLYRLTGVSEQIINNWADMVLASLKSWNSDKPYLAVHDLSQAGVSLQYAALVNFDMMNIGITMAGRFMAEEIFDANSSMSAKVAVNFNLSLSGQTNRTLMNFLNRNHTAIRYKTFYNRTKCLKWLRGELTDTAETKQVSE
jgi:hypothetical protein